MKRLLALACTMFSLSANAYVVNTGGMSLGSSWDNPSHNIDTVLSGLEDQAGVGLTLNLISKETWVGRGVSSIILEELAGYKNNTTFGWYDATTKSASQIFAGSDGKGASAFVNFGVDTDFGFYIDPNGASANRMYTQDGENTHGDKQVAIFEVAELVNTYILGWEDLDLYGGLGGDRDYQDMIVRVQVTPVPEPENIALLALGLLGLGLSRRILK